MIKVNCFRGQGVFIEGRGYGTIHDFVSPTEVRVRFREGFDNVRIDELLPAVLAPDGVAQMVGEADLDVELEEVVEGAKERSTRELEPPKTYSADDQLEPEEQMEEEIDEFA